MSLDPDKLIDWIKRISKEISSDLFKNNSKEVFMILSNNNNNMIPLIFNIDTLELGINRIK